jgi:hypothetical protein
MWISYLSFLYNECLMLDFFDINFDHILFKI